MSKIVNILLVIVLVLVAVTLLTSGASAQSGNYDLTFNCKDESSSSFVVENNTSSPLENQEAYIEVDGQTLPVNQVASNGYAFVQPAIVEGEADLYVEDTLVDSAMVGDRECNPSQTEDQYNSGDNSGNQYSPSKPSENNGGYQYGEDGSEDSQGQTEASEEGSDIKVLPDTSGVNLFALGAGSLLIGGGLLVARKLM